MEEELALKLQAVPARILSPVELRDSPFMHDDSARLAAPLVGS
jgi:hypothetical protein